MDKTFIKDECREELNDAPVEALDVPEAEHFYQCPVCGQTVDRRGLDDVLHHEQPQHDRLPEVCSKGELPPGS
jgi:bifunctional non-homologous end joining protein LigD